MNIKEFYGNRNAARSGVPLINHINEGCTILSKLGATPEAMDAYRYHPMFQNDSDLVDNMRYVKNIDPLIMTLVMEYRNIANQSLSDIVEMRPNYLKYNAPLEPQLVRSIKISPLAEVNLMLIADKVQNRKDFIKYHKDTHRRSLELDFYFNCWFNALGVGLTTYSYDFLIEGL